MVVTELLKDTQCKGDARQVVLIGVKARACEVYPDELCESVRKAMQRE